VAIGLTQRAREVLWRASEAARRFDPSARIRLRSDGGEVRFTLADESAPDEDEVEVDGVVLLVERGLDGVVDAGEHDRLWLRSGPRSGD
jgi:hypothetical protein